MFLFIFESIGTQELILIGIVALIFLGPRRMPEMAKKLGKIMADFKNTTSEFRSTWEREVNFEEEAKELRATFDEASADITTPIPRENSISAPAAETVIAAPEIKPAEPGLFDHLESGVTENGAQLEPQTSARSVANDLNAKENWL